MKQLAIVLSSFAGALALVSVALAGSSSGSMMSNMHAANMVSVTLSPQNNSGQSGTAVLAQQGANVVVTLKMTGIPAGVAEPAHIHPGTCAKLNPVPKYPLTNATNGTTTTTISNVQLSSLTGGKFAINVHNAKTLSIYVACGNIQ